MPYVLDIVLIVIVVGLLYFSWGRIAKERRFRTFVLRPLVISIVIIVLLLACRFFHVLCLDNYNVPNK
jgi:putative effector of murein hydrolase